MNQTSRSVDLYQFAVQAHQAGRYADAEKVYRQVLSLETRHADACHMLGLLYFQTGKLTDAIQMIRQAVALREDVHFLVNLASVLTQAKQLPQAEAAYRRALALNPGIAEAHFNLGLLLEQSGRIAEAEAAYRRALQLKPTFGSAHYNLGILLAKADRLADAEQSYRHAIAYDPTLALAYFNLGTVLARLGRLTEAEAALRRVIEMKPNYEEAYCQLGALLVIMNRSTDAEAVYHRALALLPNSAPIHYKLGVLHASDGRLDQAESAYRRAMEVDPAYLPAYNSLGNLLKQDRRMAEAEKAFRLALQRQPNYSVAHWNLSWLLLSQGRYQEAWPHFEHRHDPHWDQGVSNRPKLPWPQWQGEALGGKSLLLWSEQGFGDTIQFSRYAILLKQRGLSRLTLACPPPLIPLLKSLEGVDAVITNGATLEPHDYWAFPLSIPLYFNTALDTIPDSLPYLSATPAMLAKWRERLPSGSFIIGLVWKGSAAHHNDANRSLRSLQDLAPLWAVPGVSFVSLQKEQGADEARQFASTQPLLDLGSDIQDFGDAAAIVSQLDLVICVDTAIAHLAGALGKPCWVLLPAKSTDWRWLLDRSDSPWYPNVLRLYRQGPDQDWHQTIGRVADDLKNLRL